jgi:hypothetical protein
VESGGRAASPTVSLRQVMEHSLRVRHYSPRTAKVYLAWTRRLIRFHRRYPRDLGAAEVKAFLDSLANEHRVSLICRSIC